MTTTITRAQIKALRSEAYAAGDYVQAAICEVAMDRHASAMDVCDEHGVWTALERRGVIPGNVTTESVAEAICAKAIASAAAQG